MNQILVTEKIYVTPELKRKKKLYKINFFLSVFLICSLFSYYIYAEFDKNKSEEVSQEILASLDLGGNFNEMEDSTTARVENNVLIVTLDESTSNNEEIDITKLAKDIESYIQSVEQNKNTGGSTAPVHQETYKTSSGAEYVTDAVLKIPSLDINYPVLKTAEEHIDEILKISLVKYWGNNANEVGNFCISGHNYKDTFAYLGRLENGDTFYVVDKLNYEKVTYKVYDKFTVNPTELDCIDQETEGKREVTLITCNPGGLTGLIIKASEI